MRREDIDLDTEYCETGPLAYGSEPRVPAYRVKFLAKTPGWRIVHTYRLNREGDKVGWAKWERISHEVLPKEQAIAFEDDVHRNRQKAWEDPSITEVRLVDKEVKGALPVMRARVFDGKVQWEPGLCTPASVHRTWTEYTLERQARELAAELKFRERAPQVVEDSIVSALATALRFQHEDLDAAVAMVEDAMVKVTGRVRGARE